MKRKKIKFPLPYTRQVTLPTSEFMEVHRGQKRVLLIKADSCDPGVFLQVIEVDEKSGRVTGKYIVVIVTHGSKYDDTPARYLRKGCMAVSVRMVAAGFEDLTEEDSP